LIEVKSLSDDHPSVSLQLGQSTVAGEPYITVVGEAGHVVLSIRQARAMSYALTVEGRRATAPGAYPPRRWRGPFKGEPR
jgi:hypothetical protein